MRASLLAVGPGEGELADSAVAWRIGKGVPVMSSPVIAGDAVCWVSDDGVAVAEPVVVELAGGLAATQHRDLARRLVVAAQHAVDHHREVTRDGRQHFRRSWSQRHHRDHERGDQREHGPDAHHEASLGAGSRALVQAEPGVQRPQGQLAAER